MSITRRAMLAALPVCLAGQTARSRSKGKPLPSVGEFVRFNDPTTENPIVRLTSLKSASYLPAAANRFVSVKARFLLFSSDRNQQLAPFQVDLRNGMVRQLAEPAKMAAASLCMDSRERAAYFIDGGDLRRVDLAGKKAAQTLRDRVNTFSLSEAGPLFAVREGKLDRLEGDSVSGLASDAGPECLARPDGSGCLFTRPKTDVEREYWYAGAGRPVLLASGRISNPFWSADGQSLVFLREVPGKSVALAEIHEVALDGSGERVVAPTSQFATFAPNFDGTVFVGASRSKAQPDIVLLLRSAKREMTLCQHRASRPSAVDPVFSPDAKRVYFQSDEEGQPAIYSVNVELLVEPASDL